MIFEDIYSAKISGGDVGVNFRDFIYEGSGRLWREALQNPGAMVDWIIVRPSDVSDEVSHTIDMNSPAFLAQFTLVLQEPDGIYLYHHTGRLA